MADINHVCIKQRAVLDYRHFWPILFYGQTDINHAACCTMSCVSLVIGFSFDTINYHRMMIDIDLLLTWGATYKKVQRDEIIFHEGASANFYYQVVSGTVRWVSINEEGREFIQLMVEQGESFGELPLFDDDVYAATAIAEEDSVIIRLHKSNFLQLLKDNPAIHFAFTRLMAERMRFKFLTIRELAYYDPEHRISTLLNYFKQSRRHTCPNCKQVKLTRQQIANMTGLRVETVIRAMRHLHDKGKLVIDKGKVYC